MQKKLDQLLYDLGIAAPEARRLFLEQSVINNFPKNHHLLEEGKKNYSEYLLLSGVMHRYRFSDQGESVTSGFYMPGAVITPHFARTREGFNLFSIETLTEVTIAEIPVRTLDSLRLQHPAYQQFGQKIVEKALAEMFIHEVVFRSYTAKGRLLYLREQYPNLENLVSHQVIASFLGITHVSLSRLRRELTGSPETEGSNGVFNK